MVASQEDIAELWRVHKGPVRADALRSKSLGMDDTRKWVDPKGYRLSDRLWNQRADIRAKIEEEIRKSIALGEDAIRASKRMEKYLNPAHAPLRTVDGRVIKDGRKGVLTSKPRGGTGSYPARRLMRTETTRAHGQAQLILAEKFPSVVRWALSPSHPEIDICDDYADRDEGYGRGRYLPRNAPRYPAHPHCLCTLRIESIENDRELVNRLRREFDLGDELDDDIFDALGVAKNNGRPFDAAQARSVGPRPESWAKYDRGENFSSPPILRAVDRIPDPPPPPPPQEWKPVMSKEEAEAWASQGIETRRFFHGTGEAGRTGIRQSGFNVESTRFGRMWGNGVYASPNYTVAADYAASAGGHILELRIKANRIFKVDADVIGKPTTREQWLSQHLPNGDDFLARVKALEKERLDLQDEWRSLDNLIGSAKNQEAEIVQKWIKRKGEVVDRLNDPEFVDTTAFAITEWGQKNGYDALELKKRVNNPVGADQIVVFDPQRVTVIDLDSNPDPPWFV
jgi:hypothetical protein